MAYAPCKNPNCKSYGQPHPNCRCYGEMAEGGYVRFCEKDQGHNPKCEYFAEGGMAAPIPEPAPEPAVSGKEVPMDKLPSSGSAVPENKMPKSGAAVPADKLPSIEPVSGQEVPTDKIPGPNDKYKTPGQLDMLQTESFARGLLGPLATGAELGLSALGVPGMSAEEQLGRQKAYPEDTAGYESVGQVVGLASLKGIASSITSASKAITASKVVQGAIQMGLFQVGDEISKTMLEGIGNHEHPWSAALIDVGAAGLAGLIGGKTFETIGKGVAGVTPKIAKSLSQINSEKYFEEIVDKLAQKVVKYGATLGAYEFGGLKEAMTAGGFLLGKENVNNLVSKLIGKPVGKGVQKYVAPVVVKALGSNNPAGLMKLVGYAQSVGRGMEATNNAVNSLFKTGAQQGINFISSEENREKLGDWLTNGGITQNIEQQIFDDNDSSPTGFAKGGEVKKHKSHPKQAAPILEDQYGLENHYPEQNVMMNAAKGRMSNYLSGLRPQPKQPALIFDSDPDLRSQKKSYHRALDIANHPLSVIDEIRKGTIEPEHVAHLNALYPEVSNFLKSKITERIMHAKLKGEKPSHKVRQGLSMFMGTALSAEVVPANIMAAQSVFANKKTQQQQPQQGGGGSKGSTKALSKSDSAYLTGDQALSRRRQKA